MRFLVITLLVAICGLMAQSSSAADSLISECQQDLLMALADMAIPDEVVQLTEQVKQLFPGRALVHIEEDELSGKFKAPEACESYISAITSLLKFDSCDRLVIDSAAAQTFWAGIKEGSALDRFLGSSRCCKYSMV